MSNKIKVLALGGGGRIAREAALDLAWYGDFEKITIADKDIQAAEYVARWIGSSNVDFIGLDIFDEENALGIMKNYDIVMDGTTISHNDQSTKLIALSGCHGVNLNGFGEEYKYNEIFEKKGKVMIPGFGMTPGTTNMMAKFISQGMDEVDTVRISHGAFRPIAFSKSIAETTIYEYDEKLSSRVVFENGKMIQVPPFARPLEVKLPEPYGITTQYIIPHSETITMAEYLQNKNVKLIEVRGCWPRPNMELLNSLHHYGFLRNDKIALNGHSFGIMDAIGEYLFQSDEGHMSPQFGYSLHVDITGIKEGKRFQHILTHTHPRSDGSAEGWENLRAYTRNVGIPLAVAVILISKGIYECTGVKSPENVLEPAFVFEELKKRDIHIHSEIINL